ncbi:MAG: class I adenylate-forming enzyme family protein [Solirubrobacterales bacterium]
MRRANLAGAIVERAAARPDLRLGTVDDQIRLDRALGFAAGRARALLDAGLRPGAPVALVGTNSTDYLVSWLACLLAGAPVALVNPTYPADLTARMLAPVSPQMTLTVEDIAAARLEAADVGGLPGLDAAADDVASFMHTSGTTGLPKFCVQTHEYFRLMAAAVGGALELRPSDRVLAPLPMFHINPLGYGVVTSLLVGAEVLTVERFSARRFWPAVIEEQITAMILHAPPVEILKRATGSEDAAGHQVRTMFFADPDFLRRFSVPTAVSGYGSTEAGGLSHLRRWKADEEMPRNASRHGGHPRSDIEWRLDEDGIVEVREKRASALFSGYVAAAGINAARDADGWFATGDIGRQGKNDPDYLVFVERAAESIRVRGEYVPIEFVENELAAVAGLEDHALWKRCSELVDDEVVLYAVGDPLPFEALRDRIDELPAFMRPVAIAHVQALPRDAAVGKVQRRLLDEQPVLSWIDLA